jgi:hypothetical protein
LQLDGCKGIKSFSDFVNFNKKYVQRIICLIIREGY